MVPFLYKISIFFHTPVMYHYCTFFSLGGYTFYFEWSWYALIFLRRLDTLPRVIILSWIYFIYLLSQRSQLLKETICYQWEHIIPFNSTCISHSKKDPAARRPLSVSESCFSFINNSLKLQEYHSP